MAWRNSRFFHSKFWQFVRASGYWCLVAMGSGLLSLAWLLAGLKWAPTAIVVFVVSAVLFCWGAYKAWSKTDEMLSEEKRKNSEPDIIWAIKGAYIEEITATNVSYLASKEVMLAMGLRVDFALVMLDLEVANDTNVPTTIPKIELSINTGTRLHHGTWLRKKMGFWVEKQSLFGTPEMISQQPIDLEITSINPLARGIPRRCWAIFRFDDLPAFEYENALVILTIQDGTFKDKWDKQPVSFERGKVRATDGNDITIVPPQEEEC